MGKTKTTSDWPIRHHLLRVAPRVRRKGRRRDARDAGVTITLRRTTGRLSLTSLKQHVMGSQSAGTTKNLFGLEMILCTFFRGNVFLFFPNSYLVFQNSQNPY